MKNYMEPEVEIIATVLEEITTETPVISGDFDE